MNLVADALSRLPMDGVAHVEEKNEGTSEGCLKAFSLGSLPYMHIKQWSYCSELGKIFFCSGGHGKER